MTQYLDEDTGLKDFSSTEDISNETTRTLFAPKTMILDDNELEEPGFDCKNKKVLKKNILEVPAVLLSPCSRRTSCSAEKGLKSGCSSEFLVPPTPINTARNSSTTSLVGDKQQIGRIVPRKLSLSLPSTPSSSTDFIFNSGPFNGYSHDFYSIHSQDNYISDDQSSEGKTSSEYGEFSFASHGCLASSLRASTSLRAPDPEIDSETTRELPVAVSTPNLYRPSTQLYCLLNTNYTALSTPSSECSSRSSNQNFEGNSGEKDEHLLPNEFHCCMADESELPLLPTGADTRETPSRLVLNEQPFVLPQKYETGFKKYSTPDLRLDETFALPSDWGTSQRSLEEGDALNVARTSSRLKSPPRRSNTISSTFLHPDSARCSSFFEGSAVSLPQAISSKVSDSRSRSAVSDIKRPKLRHQSSSIHSFGSSACEESSTKRDTSSVVKSFLSLIRSPSRLLAKLSASRQSVRSMDSRAYRRNRRDIDFSSDNKIVTLNVSGRRFQINDYFLSVYPKTLLGSKTRNQFYDKDRNEFFFDRDPDCFRYIWNFYHSGELHCPREECVQSFLDEVAFFGLDVSMLCDCCWQETFEPAHEKLTKRRAELQEAEKEAAEATYVLEPDATFREKVWITLEEPSFSFIAKMFYLMSVFVIAVSVVANTTETIACKGAIRICKVENEETYFYIDTVCVGFFTFEYILRLMVCPNRLKFVIQLMSIVDILAILPYYINLLLEYLSLDANLGMDALVVLRVLRTLRVFKLLRHSKRLQKLTQTIRDSASELCLIGFVYAVMVILFSSIIYFAELSDDTQFTSIPQAMWYAVITSTTAGYGDIIPVTLAGRLVGSACCLFGVLVIALPIPILQIK